MTGITSENFEQEVLQAGKVVVIDFFAEWCAPCRMLAPVLEELAAQMRQIKFCKVDVDAQMELAMQFRVTSIPTLLVVKNSRAVRRLAGYRSKEDLQRELEAVL